MTKDFITYPSSEKVRKLEERYQKMQMKKAKVEYNILVAEVLEDEVQHATCYEVGRIE